MYNQNQNLESFAMCDFADWIKWMVFFLYILYNIWYSWQKGHGLYNNFFSGTYVYLNIYIYNIRGGMYTTAFNNLT